jgi:hypothetical protein
MVTPLQPASKTTGTPAPSTGSTIGAFVSHAALNYALPALKAVCNKVASNPGTALLATFTTALLVDRYNKVNNPKLPDVEIDEFRPGETKETRRRLKIKADIAQLPLKLHRTVEMDTIDWKLRLRNLIVVAQLAVGIAALALLGSSFALAHHFSQGALIGFGIWLIANSYLTFRLGRHLKMDKYTVEVPPTEHNQFLNLNKAKYRSNLNNTVRFVVGSIPLFTPLVFVSIQLNKWKKEGEQLARIYHV